MPDPVAAHVIYSGRVQGVGFRATAAHIAVDRPITGWVRNLANGDVELHAEGDRTDVEAYLTAIRERFARKIIAEDVDWQAGTGRYTSFNVVS